MPALTVHKPINYLSSALELVTPSCGPVAYGSAGRPILFILRHRFQNVVKFTPRETKFLRENEACRVATCSSNVPHIAPVTYYFEAGRFYFATDYDTKKYSYLKKNAKIAISVDLYKPGGHKAVVVEGTASMIERGSEFRRLYGIFHKNYAWVRAMPWKEGEAPFVRIIPKKKSSWGLG